MVHNLFQDRSIRAKGLCAARHQCLFGKWKFGRKFLSFEKMLHLLVQHIVTVVKGLSIKQLLRLCVMCIAKRILVTVVKVRFNLKVEYQWSLHSFGALFLLVKCCLSVLFIKYNLSSVVYQSLFWRFFLIS